MTYTYKYPRPAVTADCIVMTRDSEPKVLLIQRGAEPYKGCWAFPGGFMDMDETTDQCAIRELDEETGLKVTNLHQVGAYSKVDRDPRGRTITVAYLAIIDAPVEVIGQDDAAQAQWFPLSNLPKLAFDHDEIMKDAVASYKELIKTFLSMTKGFELLSGNEKFIINGNDTGLSVKDFWRFEFSSLMDILGYVAEFIIAKALGKEKPENSVGWTLYDLTYKEKKIEVKTTSYYHSWQQKDDKISEQRTFSIRKTHKDYKVTQADLVRNNDIYIFCVDVGRTKETANPLNLDNWRFYVVPTQTIENACKNQKTISLGRIQSITGMKQGVPYDRIKEEVDRVIESS